MNAKTIATSLPRGMVLLDFIRYHEGLTGTKIGCREGDCGACTILVGKIVDGELVYTSATSCLMPLGNAQGKHIITIEGLNLDNALSPVQQAMAEEGATQCGFCTPGFVVSLSGFCLGRIEPKDIEASIDGNICRCTGYKSIQRAASRVASFLETNKGQGNIESLVEQNFLPPYFKTILPKLLAITNKTNGQESRPSFHAVGGGTDLYVQKHDEMKEADIEFLFDQPAMNGIHLIGNRCLIGPSTTVTDLALSPVIQNTIPGLQEYIKLVSSTPIRNMATIAGNFVNASPIGDFTIFFLALDAQLELTNGKSSRTVALRKFYNGYKILDRLEGEKIRQISFELAGKDRLFHFEKISKRTNLDIASVNSAISLQVNGNVITEAGLSAGGVGPIPLFLQKASDYMKDKFISEELVRKTIALALSEVSPISDARGTAAYKKLALSQLIKAHFISLFPHLSIEKILMPQDAR